MSCGGWELFPNGVMFLLFTELLAWFSLTPELLPALLFEGSSFFVPLMWKNLQSVLLHVLDFIASKHALGWKNSQSLVQPFLLNFSIPDFLNLLQILGCNFLQSSKSTFICGKVVTHILGIELYFKRNLNFRREHFRSTRACFPEIFLSCNSWLIMSSDSSLFVVRAVRIFCNK